MTNRLMDLTAGAAALAFVWLAVTRLAFVLGPDACWTTC
jgi:hypothetical protein